MKKVAIKLGIDRAVFFTLLGRGWNIGAGILTIIVITHFLSPELQGYYYTFNSLIALQVFAELGLNFAIVQFASHEMAHLSWQTDGTVSGDPEAKRRLQSLVHFAFSWFGVAALLMIAFLLPAGLFFFWPSDSDIIAFRNVGIPWTLLVILTATNFFVGASVAILEGCGKVAHVAVLRLWQSLLAITSVWIVLYLGGELYALAVNSLIMALIGSTWLWGYNRQFFRDLIAFRTHSLGMSWRKEIWPFQWRIAVSWMSGYLVFQLFNPLLFRTQGPIVAGQMGMSLQIISAMNAAAIAWISTKAPIYGQLVATNQRNLLDILFARGLFQSFGFLLGGVVSAWLVLFYLHDTESPYAARVLPLSLFSILLLVCLANHIVFSQSFYLRAHKLDPFMWISVLAGVSTLVLAALLVPSFGAKGAIYSFTIPSILFGLIGGSIVFFRIRKKWASKSCA